MEFTTPAMKKMIKNNSGKRVSEDAADRLGEILETFAGDVSEEARAIAEEDGRKTVRKEDIREALK
jgi:histone H3/H4